MGSLLDIAPLSETVTVSGVAIEVKGVSALGIASLMKRFPEFRELLSGNEIDIGPDQLFELVPNGVAAIIAAGCGHPGNQEAEGVAEGLPVAEQLELLQAILRLTMPDGIVPFAERVRSLFGSVATLAPEEAAGDVAAEPS